MTEKLNQITKQEMKLKHLEEEKDNLLFEKENIEIELENIKEEENKQKYLFDSVKSKEEHLRSFKNNIFIGMSIILLISVISSVIAVLSLGNYNYLAILKTVVISLLIGLVFSLFIEYDEIKNFLLIKKEDGIYKINKRLKEIEVYLVKLSNEKESNLNDLAKITKKLNVVDYRLLEEEEKLRVLVCEKEQLYTDLLMFIPPSNNY